MNKSTNRILSIAVVLLLITNIALVTMMMMGKNKGGKRGPGNRNEPSQMMVKELNMTEQQQKDFKQLKEEHFKNTRPLFDSLRAAKTAFFDFVKEENVSDSVLNSYSLQIAERQTALDKITFAHFKKVRGLFTPEQQPKFDAFIQKMMQRGRRDSATKDK